MIYVTLFVMFFRIGLFSFGGGLAMLPLIFQSVKDFGMMTASEFSDLVALSQVTPGPIAVNAATYVGFNGAGIPGALAATLGVALPSFIPVSYTHLDVYKRQIDYNALFLVWDHRPLILMPDLQALVQPVFLFRSLRNSVRTRTWFRNQACFPRHS